MKTKVLVVAAHPDDEILGCGGTINSLIPKGNSVSVLILGDGVSSRYKKNRVNKKMSDAWTRELHLANRLIGVDKIYTFDFPDNRFDSVPLLDIVKKVEALKIKINPEIIFTHYEHDLNIDHQITYRAVITATRPQVGETVKTIYSFEVPSSTEWNFPLSFFPNVYFSLKEKDIKAKLEAMSQYRSELHPFPHPRSLEYLKLNAQYWGIRVGVAYAEAFICVRDSKT